MKYKNIIAVKYVYLSVINQKGHVAASKVWTK